jgi:hypothetical protein
MKPAEEKHLIKAYRKVKRKKEYSIIDIRQSEWRKIKGKWLNPNGWTPEDSKSIKKIEAWVAEITRIGPASVAGEDDNEDTTPKDALDHQLSAVEGHKKIEIIDTRGTRRDPEIEAPEEKPELPPIGVELEKKPWIEKAKLGAALLAGVIIPIILIYSNNLRAPKKQSFLSSDSPSNTGLVGFSDPIPIKGVGTAFFYNQNWEGRPQTMEEKIKPLAMQLVNAYNNLNIKEIRYGKEEKRKKIKEIDENSIPMLVVVPEGKALKSNNTKLWVSRIETIYIERTIEEKTTWTIGRLKDGLSLNTKIINPQKKPISRRQIQENRKNM